MSAANWDCPKCQLLVMGGGYCPTCRHPSPTVEQFWRDKMGYHGPITAPTLQGAMAAYPYYERAQDRIRPSLMAQHAAYEEIVLGKPPPQFVRGLDALRPELQKP
jgi:hypothetical protein